MARSIDILTSDEKHLVVFAKGVTLDKSLPKYIRIKEKKESSSKEDTFNNWKSIFDNYLNEIISECTDIYLNEIISECTDIYLNKSSYLGRIINKI